MISKQEIFGRQVFSYGKQCIHPNKWFKDFCSIFCVIRQVQILFFSKIFSMPENSCLCWGRFLSFAEIFGCRRPECVVLLFCLFVRSSLLRYVLRRGSPSGIILRIAVSTGLMKLDSSGVPMDGSAICVLFWSYRLIQWCVTLTATFLLSMVDNEFQTSRLAVKVNLSIGVTVPLLFLSDGWSTKAAIVFVVMGGDCQAITKQEKLWFSSRFVSSVFDLHCQAKKMDKTTCSVND